MTRPDFLAAILALVLACAAPGGRLRAQTAASPTPAASPAEADPLAEMPKDLQTKVDGIMEKAAEARRAIYEQKMKEAMDAVVNTTGLTGDDALKTLASAAHDAAERSVAECITLARIRIGRGYRGNQEQMEMSINATVGTGGLAAQRSEGEVPPDEQPGWAEAIKRVLNPAQLAVWQVKAAMEDTKENKEINKFVDAQLEFAREGTGKIMRATTSEMAATLALSPERAAQLEALGNAAVEASLKAYRAVVLRNVRGIPAEQRQRMVLGNNRGAYFGAQTEDAPSKQTVWKEGLEKLLTDADRQRLRNAQEGRRARRIRAMGSMLVAVLDEKTALTVAQREKLQPVAERAAQEDKTLFPPDEPENNYQFTRDSFFTAAAPIKESEVVGILEPVQWRHWQQVCRDVAEGRGSGYIVRGRNGRRVNPDKTPPPLPENPDPEELERVISDSLDAKTAEERQRLLAVNLLKAEDATRIAKLGEPVSARLQTAARGMAEEALTPWKINVMQNIRSQLENGDPESFRNMLTNLPDFQFGQVNNPRNGQPSLWEKTVEHELTSEQRAAWKGEQDAREGYRDNAAALLILAEFDRRYRLTDAQWDTLQGLLTPVMRDYGTDINRMFNYSGNNSAWYFQTYTMYVPFGGIPTDKLKEVLEPARYDRWNTSPEHNNMSNYWRSVQQFHKQRANGKDND